MIICTSHLLILDLQIKEHIFYEEESIRKEEKKIKLVTQAKLTIWLNVLGPIILHQKWN